MTSADRPGEMPGSQRGAGLVSNTLVQFVAPGVRLLLGLVLVAALARHLGTAGLGEYALVFAYVAVFVGVLADWGLATIVLREISRTPARRGAILAAAASLQLIASGATYLLVVGSLWLLPYPVEVELGIALYGLTILLTPLDILALSYQADLRLRRLLPPSLAGVVLQFALAMIAIASGGPLLALVAAALGGLLVQYAWVTVLSHRAVRLSRPDPALWPGFIRQAWTLGIATVFATGMQQAPVLVLSLVSLEAVGLFNAASRIPLQLMLIPLAIRTTTFPLLSRAWASDPLGFRRQLDILTAGSCLIAAPAVVLGVGLSGPLVELLFGAAFGAAAVPFALMLATVGVMFPGLMLAEALTAAGFQHLNLAVLAAAFPLLVVLLVILVPVAGASGAALALLLSYVATVAATAGLAHARLEAFAGLRTLLPAFAAVAAGLVVLPLSARLGTLGSAVLAASASVVAMLFLQPTLLRALGALRPVRALRCW